MKAMKKLFALLLALTMVFGLAATAFAADVNYTITVTNSNDDVSISGKTYTAYRIFDLTYQANDDGTPKANTYSYKVVDAFKDFKYTPEGSTTEYWGDGTTNPTATCLVDYLETLQNDTDAVNHFAKAVFQWTGLESLPKASGTVAEGAQTVTINVGAPGYYLVAGKANATDNDDKEIVASCSLTTAKPGADIYPKLDAPKVDKTTKDHDDTADTNYANASDQDVGDIVDFKLTSTIPDMIGFTTYTYVVHDKMSSGLTFNANSVEVKINGTVYTDVTITTGDDVDCDDGCNLHIELNNLIQNKATVAGKPVVITYNATINDAALSTNVETNTVKIEYSNNPYDSDTHETDDDIVNVYDFTIELTKVAEKENVDDATQYLSDAEFVLYKKISGENYYYFWNEDTKKIEWKTLAQMGTGITSPEDAAEKTPAVITVKKTGTDGKTSFEGLDAGTYYLHETKAPDGYNKLKDDVTVEIKVSYNSDGTINTTDTNTNVTLDGTRWEAYPDDIVNTTGTLLPSTGGIGTTLFYVFGGIMMVGAAVLLVTKKRMSV